MTDRELIDQLGGVVAVAAALGLSSPSVAGNWRWRASGIPARWRPRMLDLAKERGVHLDERAFLRLPPLPAERAA